MIVFGSVILDVVVLATALCVALYFYFTRNFNFWKNLSVPYVKPLPVVGSLEQVALQKISVGHFLRQVYEDYKGRPYVGFYAFDQPALVINDLDIIKNVLVKDSQNFLDHLADMDEELDPLGSKGLFVLNGSKWKYVRNNLSPTFTSGKMKNMFYLMEKCAEELERYLERESVRDASVEIKEVLARFTTDVIASCAFGIDSNSMKNPEAEFRVQLRKMVDVNTYRSVVTTVAFFAPNLLKWLRLKVVEPSLTNFLRETVWSTVKYREENNVVRKDFLDSLMELRKKNTQDSEISKTDEMGFKMEDEDYVAAAFSFLTAGFETSSTTMSFALYELAIQPEVQTRLRSEIQQVLQKHGQQLTYEALQEMTYLDMVVNETLRKYPTLPFLDRKCLKDYDIRSPSGKGTITIPAGTGIYIPLMAIQYDPEYFPNPEKFDPERFTEKNKQARPNYTHMPFGEGPRICIGMRFGLMQTKAGLIHILNRFEVMPCKDTPIPLVLDKKALFLSTKDGIPLAFKLIQAR